MKNALDTALHCLARGLPVPVDVTAALLADGIDASSLTVKLELPLEELTAEDADYL
jgi:hypothetical protein